MQTPHHLTREQRSANLLPNSSPDSFTATEVSCTLQLEAILRRLIALTRDDTAAKVNFSFVMAPFRRFLSSVILAQPQQTRCRMKATIFLLELRATLHVPLMFPLASSPQPCGCAHSRLGAREPTRCCVPQLPVGVERSTPPKFSLLDCTKAMRNRSEIPGIMPTGAGVLDLGGRPGAGGARPVRQPAALRVCPSGEELQRRAAPLQVGGIPGPVASPSFDKESLNGYQLKQWLLDVAVRLWRCGSGGRPLSMWGAEPRRRSDWSLELRRSSSVGRGEEPHAQVLLLLVKQVRLEF